MKTRFVLYLCICLPHTWCENRVCRELINIWKQDLSCIYIHVYLTLGVKTGFVLNSLYIHVYPMLGVKTEFAVSLW